LGFRGDEVIGGHGRAGYTGIGIGLDELIARQLLRAASMVFEGGAKNSALRTSKRMT